MTIGLWSQKLNQVKLNKIKLEIITDKVCCFFCSFLSRDICKTNLYSLSMDEVYSMKSTNKFCWSSSRLLTLALLKKFILFSNTVYISNYISVEHVPVLRVFCTSKAKIWLPNHRIWSTASEIKSLHLIIINVIAVATHLFINVLDI